MNERIKKLRKALDLTQQQFSDHIGCSRNLVANYEIGNRNPSASVINNICKTFRVNEAWLRTGEGEMFIEAKETFIDQLCQERNATALERQLLEAYFEIDPRVRGPFVEQLMKHLRDPATAPSPVDALRLADLEARVDQLEQEAALEDPLEATPPSA